MRLGLIVAAIGAGGLVSGELAAADPSAHTWSALRHCESSGNYHSVSSTGKYRGAYQFDQPTWESVGGTGRPDQASKGEQDYRALYLYRMRGWQPWECADSAHLGLDNDADGASGNAPKRAEAGYIGGGSSDGGSSDGGSSGGSSSGGGSAGSGHHTSKWDGKVYAKGDCSPSIRTFQQQLNKRGAGHHFRVTGCYKQHTYRAVVKLQRANHINPSGRIGPKTWKAAWHGKQLG